MAKNSKRLFMGHLDAIALSNNPVASALMARMRVSKEERPKVKLECLRLLSRLELDPARSKLIGGFIDSYLKLTKQEMKQYEREFTELTPTEREATMALVSSWEQKGIELGIERGIERGIEEFGKAFEQRTYGTAGGLLAGIGRMSCLHVGDAGCAGAVEFYA